MFPPLGCIPLERIRSLTDAEARGPDTLTVLRCDLGKEVGLDEPAARVQREAPQRPHAVVGRPSSDCGTGPRGACPGRGACSLREGGGPRLGPGGTRNCRGGVAEARGGGVPGGGGAVRSSDPHLSVRDRPRPLRAGLLRSLGHLWPRSAYLMPSCFSDQTNPACVCSFASSLSLILACPASGYVSLLRPKTRASSLCPIFI